MLLLVPEPECGLQSDNERNFKVATITSLLVLAILGLLTVFLYQRTLKGSM